MPGYLYVGMPDRPAEYPILPEVGHLSPAGILRRRLMFPNPENMALYGDQVAQGGEFRYIGRGICLYRVRIVQTGSDTGFKMIANGRFPAGDRLPGRTAGCREQGKGGFWIPLPARMIRDSGHRLEA